MQTSPAKRAEATERRYDIAVLGAGPAGLAASTAAARAGARTALIDAEARVGGQYWRHRAGDSGVGHRHWPVLQVLRQAARSLEGLDLFVRHAVWHVEGARDGFTVHATVGQQPRRISCQTLIIATGGYDRQLPFPGWTLPGVYTVGGVQALLKGHGVTVGRRIAVAGTGPFLLPVATGLAKAGADVIGVFEANSPSGFRHHPAAIAANLSKLVEGAGYVGTLLRRRIPYRTGTTVVAAYGADRVAAVSVARLDPDWRLLPGSEQRLDCDAVAVGYGFTPQLEIPLQLDPAGLFG